MFRGALTAIVALAIVCVIAGAVYFIAFDRTKLADPAIIRAGAQDFSLIEKGRYLATAADCASCHSGVGPDAAFSGGRPVETPFGVVLASNITPDPETGIGAWSDADFDAALRRGLRRDGSPLYPAMPYPYYAKMSRDDVRAIRAYLSTTKPIRNRVKSNRLPFPFDIRASMHVWNALYFNRNEFKPDAAKSAAWNRGAFLVEGPAHCGACHTPKTPLGGDEASKAFQGYSIQGWFAPEITNDRLRGLGDWSAEDIVAYLRTGHNRLTAATGPMAEEISLSSSRLTEPDLLAIATYLKDETGPSDSFAPVPNNDPAMTAGGAIYRDLCSGCHAGDGKGVPALFPSLAGSSDVRSRDAASLIRILLRGARSVATAKEPTAPAMPPFGWQLNDEQAAAVLTYIRNSWGSAAPAVSPGDVKKTRGALAWRTD